MAAVVKGTSPNPLGIEWTSDAGERWEAQALHTAKGSMSKVRLQSWSALFNKLVWVATCTLKPRTHRKRLQKKSTCVSTRCVGKISGGSIFRSSHVIPSNTAGRIVCTGSQWLENMDQADFHPIYYCEKSTWHYRLQQLIANTLFLLSDTSDPARTESFCFTVVLLHGKWPGVFGILQILVWTGRATTLDGLPIKTNQPETLCDQCDIVMWYFAACSDWLMQFPNTDGLQTLSVERRGERGTVRREVRYPAHKLWRSSSLHIYTAGGAILCVAGMTAGRESNRPHALRSPPSLSGGTT